MADVSRRSFLSKSSIGAVGAIGVLSAGPAALAAAAAAVSPSADEVVDDDLPALDGPLFVHIRDVATSEVEVLVDEKSVVFNDEALVAKLRRAAQ